MTLCQSLAVNSYVLGPQPIQIDMRGYISVALAGRIHAGGLTVEAKLANRQALMGKPLRRHARERCSL
jgi:protein involved in polysaccharide export with SLBB domain